MINKVLTFGFDDCEIYDRRLCDMFRKYKMAATFFLISDQLGFKCDFHRYGEDTIVERVNATELKETYRSMEIASHACNHRCPVDDLKNTVLKSTKDLSNMCGYNVSGFAYPGGSYTKEHIEKLKKLGISYARTARVTYNFCLPDELLAWNPTCKYDDPNIIKIAEDFINLKSNDPSVLYIYGHSYELTRKEAGCDFADFERLLQMLANRDDIMYLTNIKTVEWMKNVRSNY